MRRWFLFQFSAIASTGDRRRPHQTTGAIRGLKRSLKTDGRGSGGPHTKQQADDSSTTQRGRRRSRRTPSEAPNGLRRDTQGSGLCWPESERAREGECVGDMEPRRRHDNPCIQFQKQNKRPSERNPIIGLCCQLPCRLLSTLLSMKNVF